VNPHICRTFLVFLFISGLIGSAQEPTPKREYLSPQNWSKLKTGDIVFIRSRSVNAALIAALSNIAAQADADDVFTHCGIVFVDQVDGRLKVYEGAGRGRYLTLNEWRAAESKGTVNGKQTSDIHNVYVRRWNGQPSLESSLPKILEKAKLLHNTTYDQGFSWSDDHAYCSELVWKSYQAGGLSFGTLPTMSHYVDAVPTAIAQQIRAKLEAAKAGFRHGKGYDPNESAVSPEDIFRSPHLMAITDTSS